MLAAPGPRAMAESLWRDIQGSGVTLYQYSAGGDHTTTIAWSARAQRFYHLLECC